MQVSLCGSYPFFFSLFLSSKGNLKNVILHKSNQGWEAVGIDQGFTPITHPDGALLQISFCVSV
jgi:hypothetical protein